MSILDGNGPQDGPYNTFLVACLILVALPCWLVYECGVLVGLIDEEAVEAAAAEPSPEEGPHGVPGTYCGSDRAKSPYPLRLGWSSHRCLSRGDAGEELWTQCIPMRQYTDEPGTGCPGAERCCPGVGAR